MWWADEGRLTPCCQTADAELLETDGDQFNCDICAFNRWRQELDADNQAAWRVFHQVGTRFCIETRSTGAVLRKVADELTADEFGELVARLSVIYEAFYPKRKAAEHGA